MAFGAAHVGVGAAIVFFCLGTADRSVVAQSSPALYSAEPLCKGALDLLEGAGVGGIGQV